MAVYIILNVQTGGFFMTAEERMAYFQGEKRRSIINQNEKNKDFLCLKIKFFLAILLFVGFLSLDYTGYKIYGIGSEEIIQEVIKDFDLNYYMTDVIIHPLFLFLRV